MIGVASWAAGYVGLPFAEKGRDRGGVDCWGLVRLVYADRLGLELPSYLADYASTADREDLAALIRGELGPWRLVGRADARPLDAVLFRVMGEPSHVGVVAGAGRFLHAEAGVGVVLDRYDSARWARRLEAGGFFRHVGATDA